MLDSEVRKLVALKKWDELMYYDQVRFQLENIILATDSLPKPFILLDWISYDISTISEQ